MTTTAFSLPSALAVLACTPPALSAMLGDLGPEWINADEGPDTWSPYEILGHLIHGERADWISRAEIIRAQGANRRFAPYDRFAQREESEGKSFTMLLQEFSELRANNLRTVANWTLTKQDLLLTGEHPAFGEVTLGQLLATWVAHDLGHTAQIARVMAKQYREAVGPWRAYLPVLDR